MTFAAFAAINIIRNGGFDAIPFKYEYVERGGTKDAARKLGVLEHLIVKSLVFDNGKAGDEYVAVMALIHGDERVSMHKLERLSGIRHLKPSSPKDAFDVTGYLPGGICPFGIKTSIPVFMHETLVTMPALYINAGSRGVVVKISPQALSLVAPTVGDIRSES